MFDQELVDSAPHRREVQITGRDLTADVVLLHVGEGGHDCLTPDTRIRGLMI